MYAPLKKKLLKKIKETIEQVLAIRYASNKSSTNSMVFKKQLNVVKFIYLIVEYDSVGYGRISFYLGCSDDAFSYKIAQIIAYDVKNRYNRFENNYFVPISEFGSTDSCIFFEEETNTSTPRMINLLLDNPAHSPMLNRLGVDIKQKHHMVGLGLAEVLGEPATMPELELKAVHALKPVMQMIEVDVLPSLLEFEELLIASDPQFRPMPST